MASEYFQSQRGCKLSLGLDRERILITMYIANMHPTSFQRLVSCTSDTLPDLTHEAPASVS